MKNSVVIDFFVSDSIQADKEQYRLARYTIYLLMFSLAFVTLYTALFFLFNDVHIQKIGANFFGIIMTLVGFVLMKYSTTIKIPLFYYAISSLLLLTTNIAFSGGIYSIEIVWLIALVFSAYHFIGLWAGFVLGTMCFAVITVYFYLDISGFYDFKKDSLVFNPLQQYGNMLFILIYTSSTAYLMVKRNLSLKRMVLEEKDKQLREEIARDFHDELGNKLAIITSTSNLLTHNVGRLEKEKIEELTTRIEKHSSVVYKGFRDFLWSIDSNNDNLSSLFAYVKDVGEELFLFTDINFFSQYKKESNVDKVLSLELKRNLIFIIKEVLTNCFKHSKATEISFSMVECKTEVILSISDNGIGYSDDCTKGMGLENIKQRILTIDASLVKEKKSGTSYQIKIPI